MRKSLHWRLSLGLAIGVALLWIASAAVTGMIVKEEIDEVFDGALQASSQQLLQPLIYNLVEDHDDDDEGFLNRKEGKKDHDESDEYDISDELLFIVRSRDGQILLKSPHAEETIFLPVGETGFQSTGSHRIYSSVGLNGAVILSVADPLARRQEATLKALSGLALPLLGLVPLSLLGAWFVVRQSMAPLKSFRTEIEARDGSDLTPIEMNELPSEIEPIAESVNRLMARLQRTLEAERSFSANSAHELRTPVAAALAQTQRLIAETSEHQAKDRAQKIETALKSLADLCEKLLQLARAEGGALRLTTPRDIKPILQLVLHDFQNDMDRLEIVLPDAPVLLNVDPNAFAILSRNLIENALKHGNPNGYVKIDLSDDGTFSVKNDGPVIPPEQLENLLKPFERGDAQAKGFGIGLAIVAAIAEGTGAKVQLSSPAPNHTNGFLASVSYMKAT